MFNPTFPEMTQNGDFRSQYVAFRWMMEIREWKHSLGFWWPLYPQQAQICALASNYVILKLIIMNFVDSQLTTIKH